MSKIFLYILCHKLRFQSFNTTVGASFLYDKKRISWSIDQSKPVYYEFLCLISSQLHPWNSYKDVLVTDGNNDISSINLITCRRILPSLQVRTKSSGTQTLTTFGSKTVQTSGVVLAGAFSHKHSDAKIKSSLSV